MATIEVTVHLPASLAETWAWFFDARSWPVWVDGFESVLRTEGYPAEGGTLHWRSNPAGRGEVTERVLAHEPRRHHRISFTDPAMKGELDTRFEVEGDGTRLTQALDYRLLGGGPIARLGGLLFVRSQVRASMRRSLLAFKDCVAQAGVASGPPTG